MKKHNTNLIIFIIRVVLLLCVPEGGRTLDSQIKGLLLYQLSYEHKSTSDGTRTHMSLIKNQVRKPITDTEVFVGKEGFEPPTFLCHGFTDRLLHQFAYLPNLCTRLESNQRNQIKSLGHLDTRSPLCYECILDFSIITI